MQVGATGCADMTTEAACTKLGSPQPHRTVTCTVNPNPNCTVGFLYGQGLSNDGVSEEGVNPNPTPTQSSLDVLDDGFAGLNLTPTTPPGEEGDGKEPSWRTHRDVRRCGTLLTPTPLHCN